MAKAKTRKPRKGKLTEKDRKALVAEQFVKGLESLEEAIKAVEDPAADLGEWRKPWRNLFANGMPYSIGTKKPYRGMNIASTLFSTDKDGAFFDDPRWGTTYQWRVACGYVKNPEWKGRASSFKGIPKWEWKGEGDEPEHFMVPGEETRTTLICVWKPMPIFARASDNQRVWGKPADADVNSGRVRAVGSRMMLIKVFGVYNAKQIAAAPQVKVEHRDPAVRYAECQKHLDALKIDLRAGGDRAAYNFVSDYIMHPLAGQFQDDESYWSTMWHEVGHWTGHKKRLNREFGKRFGDDAYAMEELVAELSSVITCGALGIEGVLQHHEYIASWLKKVRKDPQALFTAASKAQAAATYALTGEAPKYDNKPKADAEAAAPPAEAQAAAA